jgi:hypothetical protein
VRQDILQSNIPSACAIDHIVTIKSDIAHNWPRLGYLPFHSNGTKKARHSSAMATIGFCVT